MLPFPYVGLLANVVIVQCCVFSSRTQQLVLLVLSPLSSSAHPLHFVLDLIQDEAVVRAWLA